MGIFDFLKRDRAPAVTATGADRVADLVARLDDPSPAVRLRACQELGALGPAAAPAAERLHDLIDDDDGDVCVAAASALSEIERA